MQGMLYLQDGTVMYGESFGAGGVSVAEIVFNTCMTGYQEILTDPSYAGQIINMTYPLIGNYGVGEQASESGGIYAKGFLVRALSGVYSNFTAQGSLRRFLTDNGIVSLQGLDTRKITKKIRERESMLAVISSGNMARKACEKLLGEYVFPRDLVRLVSRKEPEHIEGTGPRIAVLDFGIKSSILFGLLARGCDVTLFPYDTSYDRIMESRPEGVVLSNGPGDPVDIACVMDTIRRLAVKLPTLGICLGHQLLALTFGGRTYKLTFGHHGGNHGVKDLESGRCVITSQNHEFAVDTDSLAGTPLEITHLNLNDGTIEGIRHRKLPVFSAQFHPEASPGPLDSGYVFDRLLALTRGTKEGALCRKITT